MTKVTFVTRVLLLIAVLSLASPLVGAASSPSDGRLGGSYESFLARFGEPTEQVGGLGLLFDVPDTRYVAVQFNANDSTYGDGDPALIITVSADRDEARPATEPDPADWSLETAERIVKDLTPTDAVFGEVDETTPGSRSTTCESETLVEDFGVVSLGQCRTTYLLSSPTTVSFVTLTLTSGAPLDPDAPTTGPACVGVVAWAEASATRLETAQSLLGPLATLSDDVTEAVPVLRRMSADLDRLVDDQRSGPAPREVATANYYIIGALSDFAASIGLAADGLETSDQELVDEAIGDLDAADRRAADASGEITLVVEACDLTTGTPEAG